MVIEIRYTNLQYDGDLKKCGHCQIFKSTNEFNKSKAKSDGYQSVCKECAKVKRKKSDQKHIEKRRKAQRNYCFKNRKKVNDNHNRWAKERKEKDPNYHMQKLINTAVINTIKNYKNLPPKAISFGIEVFNHLPYTPEQLRKHIESLWEDWMSWANHGKAGMPYRTWQIDHIIPKSYLPHKEYNDNFYKCWSLNNLRPLETIANIKKSNKIIDLVLLEKLNIEIQELKNTKQIL